MGFFQNLWNGVKKTLDNVGKVIGGGVKVAQNSVKAAVKSVPKVKVQAPKINIPKINIKVPKINVKAEVKDHIVKPAGNFVKIAGAKMADNRAKNAKIVQENNARVKIQNQKAKENVKNGYVKISKGVDKFLNDAAAERKRNSAPGLDIISDIPSKAVNTAMDFTIRPAARAGIAIGSEVGKLFGSEGIDADLSQIKDPMIRRALGFALGNEKNAGYLGGYSNKVGGIWGKNNAGSYEGQTTDLLKGLGVDDRNAAEYGAFFAPVMLGLDAFTGGKGGKIDDAVKIMTRSKTAATVVKQLKKLGVSDDVARKVAPTIAESTDAKSIKSITNQAIKNSGNTYQLPFRPPQRELTGNVNVTKVDDALKTLRRTVADATEADEFASIMTSSVLKKAAAKLANLADTQVAKRSFRLGELIDDPEFFAKNKSLKDMVVRLDDLGTNTRAGVSVTGDTINGLFINEKLVKGNKKLLEGYDSVEDAVKGAYAHERQHISDILDGVDTGSDPDYLLQDFSASLKKINDLYKRNHKDMGKFATKEYHELVKRYESAIAMFEGAKRLKWDKQIVKLPDGTEITKLQALKGFFYKNILGEASARTAAKRAGGDTKLSFEKMLSKEVSDKAVVMPLSSKITKITTGIKENIERTIGDIIGFHGTDDVFDKFRTNPIEKSGYHRLGETSIGAFFSESADVAKTYPVTISGKQRRIIKAELGIKNAKKYRSLNALKDDLLKFYKENGLDLNGDRLINAQLFKESLEKQGYDGLTFLEGFSHDISKGKSRVWSAFNPDDIKIKSNKVVNGKISSEIPNKIKAYDENLMVDGESLFNIQSPKEFMRVIADTSYSGRAGSDELKMILSKLDPNDDRYKALSEVINKIDEQELYKAGLSGDQYVNSLMDGTIQNQTSIIRETSSKLMRDAIGGTDDAAEFKSTISRVLNMPELDTTTKKLQTINKAIKEAEKGLDAYLDSGKANVLEVFDDARKNDFQDRIAYLKQVAAELRKENVGSIKIAKVTGKKVQESARIVEKTKDGFKTVENLDSEDALDAANKWAKANDLSEKAVDMVKEKVDNALRAKEGMIAKINQMIQEGNTGNVEALKDFIRAKNKTLIENGVKVGKEDGLEKIAQIVETPVKKATNKAADILAKVEKAADEKATKVIKASREAQLERKLAKANEKLQAVKIAKKEAIAANKVKAAEKLKAEGQRAAIRIQNRELAKGAPEGKGVSRFFQKIKGKNVADDRYFTNRFYNKAKNEAMGREADIAAHTYTKGAKYDELYASASRGETAQDVHNAVALVNKWFDEGKTTQGVELLDKVMANATNTAQTLQAYRAFQRLTPAGMLKYAKGRMAKASKELKRDLVFPEGFEEELVTAMKQLKTLKTQTERDFFVDGIMKKIDGHIPTGAADKTLHIWKAGLLSAPTTHAVNVLSTSTNMVARLTNKVLSGFLDPVSGVINKAMGGKYQRSTVGSWKGEWQGFKEGIGRGIDYFTTGFDPDNVAAKVNLKQITYNTKAGKVIGYIPDKIFKALGAEDKPFKYAAMVNDIYDQAGAAAKNAKLTGTAKKKFIDNFVGNPTDEVIANARKIADEAVFQNDTALGELAKHIQRSKIGEFIIPFGKTPAAIATEVASYFPPVSATKALGLIIKGARKGGMTVAEQKQLTRTFSKTIMGTSLMGLGAYYGGKKMISGSYPKEPKEQARWEAEGIQPNSIKWNGRWHRLSSLGPVGLSLAIGNKFQEARAEKGLLQGTVDSSLYIGQLMTEQSFLQGMAGALKAFNGEPDWAANAVSGFIPTIFGNIAKATDPNQRETSDQDVFKRAGKQILAKIPGARGMLEKKVDVYGNELKTQGALREMADPFRSTKDTSTSLSQEMAKMGTTPTRIDSKQTLYPGTEVNLTDSQRTAFEKLASPEVADKIQKLIDNPKYQNLKDDVRSDKYGRIKTADEKRKAMIEEVIGTVRKGNLIKAVEELGAVDQKTLQTAKRTANKDVKTYMKSGDVKIGSSGSDSTGLMGMIDTMFDSQNLPPDVKQTLMWYMAGGKTLAKKMNKAKGGSGGSGSYSLQKAVSGSKVKIKNPKDPKFKRVKISQPKGIASMKTRLTLPGKIKGRKKGVKVKGA